MKKQMLAMITLLCMGTLAQAASELVITRDIQLDKNINGVYSATYYIDENNPGTLVKMEDIPFQGFAIHCTLELKFTSISNLSEGDRLPITVQGTTRPSGFNLQFTRFYYYEDGEDYVRLSCGDVGKTIQLKHPVSEERVKDAFAGAISIE